MVDWDRVELLRSRGWDWDRIAADPKVGFHPETSVKDSGRALRGLYHRQKSREGRKGREEPVIRPSKEDKEATERKWNLPRIGYLVTPIIGIWFLLAYVAPSPVGILVPAFPWLAIGFAGAAFVLLFGLLRNPGRRWSPVFRTTLIAGIVLGLFVSGLVGVTGYLAFGCPYLPPASTLAGLPGPGWAKANVGAWQEGGKPVMYFYGASWCPYCSASSWAIYKALTEFGSVSGADGAIQFSSLSDVYAGTPEIVIANLGFSSSTVSLVVTEDTSGVDGTFPGTNNCFEQAYVGAYSAGSIPFLVVNGQYVHEGQHDRRPGPARVVHVLPDGGLRGRHDAEPGADRERVGLERRQRPGVVDHGVPHRVERQERPAARDGVRLVEDHAERSHRVRLPDLMVR